MIVYIIMSVLFVGVVAGIVGLLVVWNRDRF